MSSNQVAMIKPQQRVKSGSLLLGTGLAFASLILVPALAGSVGLAPSVTGALRIALMKASNRAIAGSPTNAQAATASHQ